MIVIKWEWDSRHTNFWQCIISLYNVQSFLIRGHLVDILSNSYNESETSLLNWGRHELQSINSILAPFLFIFILSSISHNKCQLWFHLRHSNILFNSVKGISTQQSIIMTLHKTIFNFKKLYFWKGSKLFEPGKEYFWPMLKLYPPGKEYF